MSKWKFSKTEPVCKAPYDFNILDAIRNSYINIDTALVDEDQKLEVWDALAVLTSFERAADRYGYFARG